MNSPRPRVFSPRTTDRALSQTTPSLALLALLALIAGSLGWAGAAEAQTCDRSGCGFATCATPATPAPSNLWSASLQPAEASIPPERDVTGFNEFVQQYSSNPLYYAIDIQNGWAFTAMDYGVKVWDIHSTAVPTSSTGYLNLNSFPHPGDPNETKEPLQDVSLPAGVDTIGAVVGLAELGVTIVNFSNKSSPTAVYQNYNTEAQAVYAARINGVDYAFMASPSGGLPGLHAYNMDAAVGLGLCQENGAAHGSCPGVYLGRIGSRTPNYVAGVDQFVVMSSGATPGFDLYDATNPANPTLKLTGIGDRGVYGVAMWKQGSATYYLAALTGPNFSNPSAPYQLQIFDVSCLTGTCSGLPAPLSSAFPAEPGTPAHFVTFSRNGATPFLYLGTDSKCSLAPQAEWLYDVSNPAAPVDITPATGYWGWYYRENATGFNNVMARKGKFNGDYFYRAARSLFDIHKHVGLSRPVADFTWSPQPAYAGSPVQFTDLSVGQPNNWVWTFQNGSPSQTVGVQAPTSTFPVGPQTVTLVASNGQGTSDPATHTVTVLNPAPAIGSVTVSPASPLQCQPVTLTANNVTGKPPLTFAWAITNAVTTNAAPGGTSTANPFVWDTKANAVVPAQYKATVQVNGTGSPATGQVTFTLASLPALPSSFAPTNDAFTASAVQFHVNVAAATEWNWNFGDNAGGGPNHDGYSGWTNDPAAGPNPLHTYSAAGQYTVTVKVRNCTSDPNGLVGSPLQVNVVVALIAFFQAQCPFAPCAFATNSPISFVDGSSGAAFYDYDWDGTGTSFPDSGHTSAVMSHTYVNPSPPAGYSPRLQVRGANGGSAIYVHPPITVSPQQQQVAQINVSGPSSGVPNTNYTFFAGALNCSPAATWTWTASGGTIVGSATGSSIVVSYANGGTFSVVASNTGCSGAIGSAGINIQSGNNNGGPLQAAFVFAPLAPKVGDVVGFDGNSSTGSPVDYAWDFGDGGKATGATAQHAYTAAGTYTVKLDVDAPGTGVNCLFGTCTSEVTKTVTVVTNTPPKVLNSDFTSVPTCNNVGGFFVCPVAFQQAVTFTAVETNPVASFAWDFGDGTTGSGPTVSHTWQQGGANFFVTLTASAPGYTTTPVAKQYQVAAGPPPPPPPTFQSLVLPWVAQTRGALVQSSDLYLHNPGSTPLDVTLQFRKRGTPDVNPPQATLTIQPGATAFAPNVMSSAFSRDNASGFITVQVKSTDPLPVITSFNTVVRTDGGQFGQTVPGLSLPNNVNSHAGGAASTTSTFQYLTGLNDNSDQLAYFGITNPGSASATYHVRLLDHLGSLIGESNGDLTVGPFGQRQFQQGDVHSMFGLTTASDYVVSIENKSGGAIFPYGENVRLVSNDPSFVTSGSTSAPKQYVVGAFSTAGSWQTDVVLTNTSALPMNLTLTFTRPGVTAPTSSPVTITLHAGETQRLVDAISGQFSINNVVGVISISSTGASGLYPIVQAESYNNSKPANRYGQAMRSFADSDAAAVGQTQYLVGLRQDTTHLTTFWLYNPSSDFGVYDVVYRGLDGTVLGTVHDVSMPPGKLRQFLPAQHPLPAGGAANGFTVQVVVKNGKALAAAQVLTTSTGDPAYVQGAVR